MLSQLLTICKQLILSDQIKKEWDILHSLTSWIISISFSGKLILARMNLKHVLYKSLQLALETLLQLGFKENPLLNKTHRLLGGRKKPVFSPLRSRK